MIFSRYGWGDDPRSESQREGSYAYLMECSEEQCECGNFFVAYTRVDRVDTLDNSGSRGTVINSVAIHIRIDINLFFSQVDFIYILSGK